MREILWRLFLAVIGMALVFALIPPVLEFIKWSPGSAALQIVHICVVGLAIYYVIGGTPPWRKS